MVWARKQLLVYCGTGLKGTVTPAAAIKAERSAHTSDKLFVAPAAHKDVCLFAIVCEGLTKLVPAEVAAVSRRLFSTRGELQAFHLQIRSPVGTLTLFIHYFSGRLRTRRTWNVEISPLHG